MDGNSLGLLSVPSEQAVLRVLEDWKRLAIDGWTGSEQPWFFMAEEIGRRIAPLIGAEQDEVVAANSTTVNLHQLLATLFQPNGRRSKILIEADCFPSDLYAVKSHLRLRGLDPTSHLVTIDAGDDMLLSEDVIVDAMTDEVECAVLPTVVYTTGQLLEVERLAKAAQVRGIKAIFDCSHSVGAVPHSLSDWGLDAAFWCGYKYLNGGPGAIAGVYLNRRHFRKAPGLAGWFGSEKERQFDMSRDLQAATGAGALQIGSPNILSMAPLLGSLEVIEQVGIDRIRIKSLGITSYLILLLDAELAGCGIRIVTPRDVARRGGHVAFAHPEAARICKALKADGVVPDFRPPDVVRLAPVALYNTFQDCADVVGVLRGILDNRTYEQYSRERPLVS
jgi:kynureninase